MNAETDVATLTFAAEAAGDVPEWLYPDTVAHLAQLLTHASPVVREGAVYGLAKIGETYPEARDVLAQHTDTSPGVQAALEDALWTIPCDGR